VDRGHNGTKGVDDAGRHYGVDSEST